MIKGDIIPNGPNGVAIRFKEFLFVGWNFSKTQYHLTVNTSLDALLVACCGYNFYDSCLECYIQSKIIDHGRCVTRNCFRVYQTRELNIICSILKARCSVLTSIRDVYGWKNYDQWGITSCEYYYIDCPFTGLHCSNECGVMMRHRLVEGNLK